MFGVTASVERSAGGSGAGRRGLGLRLRLNKSYLSHPLKPWLRIEPFEDLSSLDEQRFRILSPILC